MNISIIGAADLNGIIGAGGKLPWRLPSDLKHFKELTTGHPVVMGRKTFESMGAKPLPGRTNIILTRDEKYKTPDGCVVAHSLSDALRAAESGAMGEAGDVFVIGGEEIYKLALSHAKKIFLTRVHGSFDGDAHFPEFDAGDGGEWQLVRSEPHLKDENNPYDYDFLAYERK